MPITRGTKQATLFGGGQEISYLLRDEFITDLAAGSVNGTAAEPGPGVRTVRDVENKLSISDGTLDFAAQVTPIFAQEDIAYHDIPIVRIAGRVVLMDNEKTSAAEHSFFFGLVDSLTPTWNAYVDVHIGFYNTSGLLKPVVNEALTPIEISISSGIVYTCGAVLRSTGAYFFLKTGTANFILQWISALGSATPLYAGKAGYTEVSSGEFIRVPDVIYLPQPLAYDTFTRANGAPGDSEGVGPDGQSTPARTWVEQSGDWEISSNKLRTAAAGAGIATISVDVADVLYQIKVTTPGAGTTPGGLDIRLTDTSNYWYLKITPGTVGTDLELVEVNAGVPTTRASADIDWVAATEYEIVVVCDGDDEWRIFVDDVAEFTYTTTNTFNVSATICGVEDEGNSNFQFDDLLIFSRGNDGAYAELDRY